VNIVGLGLRKKRKIMKWSKDPPIAPEKGFVSEYYWFYDSISRVMTAVEVWPKRWLKHYHGYWWITPIARPPEKPPQEAQLNGEGPEGSKGRSVRQTRVRHSSETREVSNDVPIKDIDGLDSDIPEINAVKKRRGRPPKGQGNER
jgi:hypothetical protein